MNNLAKAAVIFAVISALLPSVPTILKYYKDRENVELPGTGIVMPYNQFLAIWLVICIVIIAYIWSKV